MESLGSPSSNVTAQDLDLVDIIADPPDGANAQLDIVFVHGLSGDWKDTWCEDGQSHSWLQALLPREIPNARIWSCGFDARKYRPSERNVFATDSCALLRSFEIKRNDAKRPVIFVAHSLGGLILQKSLQTCTIDLRSSIQGILFLGTPNFEPHAKDWAELSVAVNEIFNSSYTSASPERSNLSFLSSVSKSFRDWLSNESFARKIVCFYEVLPVPKVGMILKRESAILPNCDSTALYADHIRMAKFSKRSDAQYQSLIQSLRGIYCLVEKSMSVYLRHSLRSVSPGRLRNLPFTPDGSEEFIASTKGSLEARNLVKLALVLEDQGYYREARENFQRAVKMFELSPGPQDTVTIFCLDKLSSLLRSASQYKMAEAYSRKCLDARIKIYGMSALPTLLSCGNLAVAMRYQNKHQTAYSLLRDALEKTHPYFSELIPRVRLLSILAKINMDCGMYDVAESLSCDVIRMSIGLYGKGHPYTLNRISDLGVIFAWKDNMPGAEAISCFALDGLEQALGRNHPLCLRTSRRLADYIRFQHRYDEASIRLERTLEAQKMQPGSHHPDTLSTMSSLGTVYALQGYIKDAEVLLREAHQGQEASLGLKHSSTQWTSYALSGLKVLQQEYASQDMSRDRKVQPRLLEFLGPKSGPVTKYDLKRNPHINSPFGDALDDNIITAAIEGDYFGLETTLKRNTVSEQTIARALREAAASCQETALTLLLDCGAPINEPGGFHGTALQAASFAGNKAVVQRLLDQRADINIAGGIFGNPIGASILGHHADVTRLLLTHHPGQIFAQEILDSSLQFAIATGQDSIVKTLLEIGADVNAEDNLFGSPLHQAISSGQKEIISLLLAHNADVDKNEGIFGCPLEAAIAMDDKFAIERLLKSRANLRPLYSGLTSQPSDDYSKGYETTLARLLLGKPMNNLEVTEFSSTNTPAIPDSYPLAMSAIVSQEPPTLPISQPGESIKVVSNTSRPITGSKPKSSQQSAQIPGLRRRALKECRRVLERVLRIKNIPKHKKLRLGKRNKYKDI